VKHCFIVSVCGYMGHVIVLTESEIVLDSDKWLARLFLLDNTHGVNGCDPFVDIGMNGSRYSVSRQKACDQCSRAKTKCDRRPGACSRCAEKGVLCEYPVTSGNFTQAVNMRVALTEGLGTTSSPAATASQSDRDQQHPERLVFSDLELSCPINADEIGNRWLNPYVPDPTQKVKQYPANITSFIYRILKSYAAAAARGHDTLPFVHSMQMEANMLGGPLTTCLSLVRMCVEPIPGSEDASQRVLQQEMETIVDKRATYDEVSLLGAFQAYLIYSLVLYFRLGLGSNSSLRQIMMNLQDLAAFSVKHGLVCVAEQRHTRPKWEEWIVAESKRRTLYAMYLFDSILSCQEGLPTFLGTELEGLPAVASKPLWQAQTRTEWEAAYNVHLAEWVDRSLTIEELWSTPPGMDESEISKRRQRADQWLENIDEFGTMLYAVMCCTHGG
jgi:hypothetical protein